MVPSRTRAAAVVSSGEAAVNPLIGSAFFRMHGSGNAILVLDLRGRGALDLDPGDVRAIGAALPFDQLMAIGEPRGAGAAGRVAIYNIDGSRAGACGNGTRCVAWVLMRDIAAKTLTIESDSGPLVCRRTGPLAFAVDMGAPRLRWDEIPLAEPFFDTRGIELQIGPIDAPILHTPSVVSMGNPHAVFWVDDVAAYDLARIGALLEAHPIFPERANISLAQVVARDHIRLRVWERGAGLTLACGTAACAALVAAVRRDLCDRRATVTLPGGDLLIEWRVADDHVILTGPVALEAQGVLDAALFDARAA